MNESFAIQGYTMTDKIMCFISGDEIYQTDYLGQKRLIGKTSAAYSELEQTTTEYYNKLVELGVIVPEKTQEELIAKYAAYGDEEMGMEDEHAEKKVAVEIVNHMVNVDGSHGAHWPMEQTTAILEQRGYSCDPAEFYVVMNMMYSDYHNVFQRYGVETPEFYADMARAWLDDPDAKKDKTAEYFCHVVKK